MKSARGATTILAAATTRESCLEISSQKSKKTHRRASAGAQGEKQDGFATDFEKLQAMCIARSTSLRTYDPQ